MIVLVLAGDTASSSKNVPNDSKSSIKIKQCYFLFKQALDADESGLGELALELYTRAVDLAIVTVSF